MIRSASFLAPLGMALAMGSAHAQNVPASGAPKRVQPAPAKVAMDNGAKQKRVPGAAAAAAAGTAGAAAADGAIGAPQANQPGAASAAPLAAQVQQQATQGRWNGLARLLAGMDVDDEGELGRIERRPSITRHRRELDVAWNGFLERRLFPMQRFVARELNNIAAAAGPVFYPFSGPDALHAIAMFPRVAEFVFTGLEPVGEVPDLAAMSEDTLREGLLTLRRSMSNALEWSFFKTHEMQVDLRRNPINGVTPIMLVFLARHDLVVRGVDMFTLDARGQVRDTGGASVGKLAEGEIPGVRIRFTRLGDARERRITYLNADISDSGLAKTPQYLEFVRASQTRATFIKSASYLMHDDAFSRIRGFIVERSNMIVQDDSGVPFRFLADGQWGRRLYGTYNGPIPMFNNRMQKEVRAAYVEEGAIGIDFAFGYNFKDRGNNIQRFMRKVEVAAN